MFVVFIICCEGINISLLNQNLKGENSLKRMHKPYLLIEQFFKEQNINLLEVACFLNISLASLYNKLHGRSDFTLSEAVALGKKYGLTADLFCE